MYAKSRPSQVRTRGMSNAEKIRVNHGFEHNGAECTPYMDLIAMAHPEPIWVPPQGLPMQFGPPPAEFVEPFPFPPPPPPHDPAVFEAHAQFTDAAIRATAQHTVDARWLADKEFACTDATLQHHMGSMGNELALMEADTHQSIAAAYGQYAESQANTDAMREVADRVAAVRATRMESTITNALQALAAKHSAKNQAEDSAVAFAEANKAAMDAAMTSELNTLRGNHIAADTDQAKRECFSAAMRHATAAAGIDAALQTFEDEHEHYTRIMSRASRHAYKSQWQVLQSQEKIDESTKKLQTAQREHENLKERARKLALHVQKHAQRHNLKYGVHPWLTTACEQVKDTESKVAAKLSEVDALKAALEEDIAQGVTKTQCWHEVDTEFVVSRDMSLGYRDQWGIAATHRNAAHAASQKQMYQDIATAHKRAFAPHNLDAAAMSFKWREIMPPEVENGTLEHLA